MILLQQRIGLLLDVDQPGRSPNRLSGRPDSCSSSIKAHAFDALSSELDDWLATSSTSRPQLNEYEPEIPQRSLARGPVHAIVMLFTPFPVLIKSLRELLYFKFTRSL